MSSEQMERVVEPIWQPAALGRFADRLARLARQIWCAHGWMALPAGLAVMIRLLDFVTGAVGAGLLPLGGFPGALQSWLRKDATWYLQVAMNGYSYSPRTGSAVNFFPLYPLAIRLVEPLVGLVVGPRDAYFVAGLAVSWLSFIAACVMLYRLVSRRLGEPTALLTVLLLSVFPFSCFFGTAYSESLYLLGVVLAFLGIEQRRWWLAAVCAALAAATRAVGVVVILTVAVAYGLDWLRTRRWPRWDVLWSGVMPLGFAAYAAYCWLRFGDPTVYVKASSLGWGGGHLQLGSLTVAMQLLTGHSSDPFAPLHLAYLIALGAVLLSCVWIGRLLGTPYVVYTLGSALAPLLDFSQLNGLGRYLSVAFPAFVVLAYALRRQPVLRDVLMIGFAMFLGVATVMFTTNHLT